MLHNNNCVNEEINIEEHLGLIIKTVNEYYHKNVEMMNKYDKDDVLNDCVLLAYKLRDRYDSSKGYKFSTYLCSSIKMFLFGYCLQDKNYYYRPTNTKVEGGFIPHNLISGNSFVDNENYKTELFDLIPNNTDEENDTLNKIIVEKLFKLCDKEEKELLIRHFYLQEPQWKIAKSAGKCQSTIHYKIKRILERFKKALGDDTIRI